MSLQTHRLETLNDVRAFVVGAEAADIALLGPGIGLPFRVRDAGAFRYQADSHHGLVCFDSALPGQEWTRPNGAPRGYPLGGGGRTVTGLAGAPGRALGLDGAAGRQTNQAARAEVATYATSPVQETASASSAALLPPRENGNNDADRAKHKPNESCTDHGLSSAELCGVPRSKGAVTPSQHSVVAGEPNRGGGQEYRRAGDIPPTAKPSDKTAAASAATATAVCAESRSLHTLFNAAPCGAFRSIERSLRRASFSFWAVSAF